MFYVCPKSFFSILLSTLLYYYNHPHNTYLLLLSGDQVDYLAATEYGLVLGIEGSK